MNRDLAAKATLLRNIALQYERGDLDAEFTAAPEKTIPEMRATVVRRLREIANSIESRGAP